MFQQEIILPSKLNIVEENGPRGTYEIEGLYPGYGHTLGNALRRIILSSLPGVSIIAVRVKGADHEFSTLAGVREDVLSIILNLRKINFRLLAGEEAIVHLHAKGVGVVTAQQFEHGGEVEIANPDQYVAEITTKSGELDIELHLAKGIGYLSKENVPFEGKSIGTIIVDAIFSPIRKVRYEVEDMRVGDRTDYNRLKISIETDGSLSAREALESALQIMLRQIRAILDLKEEENVQRTEEGGEGEYLSTPEHDPVEDDAYQDDFIDESERVELLKTRIDTLDFSSRTERALSAANIRTLGGLVQKTEDELLAIEGFGKKSLEEVLETLATFKLHLKNDNS